MGVRHPQAEAGFPELTSFDWVGLAASPAPRRPRKRRSSNLSRGSGIERGRGYEPALFLLQLLRRQFIVVFENQIDVGLVLNRDYGFEIAIQIG